MCDLRLYFGLEKDFFSSVKDISGTIEIWILPLDYIIVLININFLNCDYVKDIFVFKT